MTKPAITRFFTDMLFFVLDKKGVTNEMLIQQCNFNAGYICDLRKGRKTLSEKMWQYILDSFGISLLEFLDYSAPYKAHLKQEGTAAAFQQAGTPVRPVRKPKSPKPDKLKRA